MNTAAETLLAFWENPRNIPFKGSLISDESPSPGMPETTCMCAQGQALFIVGGYSKEELFSIVQDQADKEVAKLLDISVAQSVLLRKINDSQDGAPSDVLTNPQKYLGPNWDKVLEFWHKLDSLTEEQWKIVTDRYRNLDYSAKRAAREAAWEARCGSTYLVDVASVVTVDAAKTAASKGAAGDAAASVVAVDASLAAGYATLELMSMHILLEQDKKLTFVPMFDSL